MYVSTSVHPYIGASAHHTLMLTVGLITVRLTVPVPLLLLPVQYSASLSTFIKLPKFKVDSDVMDLSDKLKVSLGTGLGCWGSPHTYTHTHTRAHTRTHAQASGVTFMVSHVLPPCRPLVWPTCLVTCSPPPPLQASGVTDMFDRGSADFTRISPGLFVSGVLHKVRHVGVARTHEARRVT